MIRRILVAVDDSPAALAAARLAVELAQAAQASLRAVAVVADHAITEQLRVSLGGDAGLAGRRVAAADAVLRHVTGLAERAAVPVETVQAEGETAAQVLAQSRAWPADLIVIGRPDPAAAGRPYLNSHIRHLLEFAERPVLVVPPAPAG